MARPKKTVDTNSTKTENQTIKIDTTRVAKVPKVKEPKVKLMSYTIKAIIPTGMYSNIQPEVTVQADTLEHAERMVMPHIEALFAKYRENGTGLPIQKPVATPPAGAVNPPSGVIFTPTSAPAGVLAQAASKVAEPAPVAPVAPVTPAIVMSVPFNRAKSAIDSCMSIEALQLVSDQIEKSEKLIGAEKTDLNSLVLQKKIVLTPRA